MAIFMETVCIIAQNKKRRIFFTKIDFYLGIPFFMMVTYAVDTVLHSVVPLSLAKRPSDMNSVQHKLSHFSLCCFPCHLQFILRAMELLLMVIQIKKTSKESENRRKGLSERCLNKLFISLMFFLLLATYLTLCYTSWFWV